MVIGMGMARGMDLWEPVPISMLKIKGEV